MDNSFRTAQAVSDLIHHVKPLLAQHLAAVAEASGMTLAETGEAFRALRDDGYVFKRDETLRLLDGLETIAITQAEGFDLASAILLADVLQRRQPSGLLAEFWDEVCKRLHNWPATLRSAVANGLRRAAELSIIVLNLPPTDQDCQTRQPDEIAEYLLQIARSMRQDELDAVAHADRGQDVEKHLSALREVIAVRDGIMGHDHHWFPSEVVELTAHDATAPGFSGCTAILLINAMRDGDGYGWFDFRWPSLGPAYCEIRPSARDPILAGLRYLYEANPEFLLLLKMFPFRLNGDATIPVVDDL